MSEREERRTVFDVAPAAILKIVGVGALIALPIAAMVPVIERVWLRDYLARDAVATRERIQTRRAS